MRFGNITTYKIDQGNKLSLLLTSGNSMADTMTTLTQVLGGPRYGEFAKKRLGSRPRLTRCLGVREFWLAFSERLNNSWHNGGKGELYL